MLLVLCNLTRACAKGENLTEVVQVGSNRVALSNGQYENRPVWGSVYLHGLPLGESPNAIEAPIDLNAGDVLRIWDNFPERILYDVQRKGKTIWTNEPLAAEQDARGKDRNKVHAARRALE